MDESSLRNDLDALVRVRNRLVQTNDSALPKVLTNLLPRLLERMERNHKQLTTPPTVAGIKETQQLLMNKTQTLLRGILMHVLERIRTGLDTLPPGAPWVTALLPLLQKPDLESPMATTFLLMILQNSMPRYISDDNEPFEPSELSVALPPLLEFVHRLHYKIIMSTPETIPESLLLNYRTATWICLDVVALTWGLPVLLDWGRDFFDEYEWCTPTSAMEAFLQHGPSRHTQQQHSIDNFATTGAFQLWLDLLLFWPEESQQRRRFVRTEAEVLVRNSTGMTPEGKNRMNYRKNKGGGQHMWNERYLRELKLACMECVVVEPLRPLRAGNFDDIIMGEHQGPLLRSLILCILTASTGSMHGKIAIAHVNRIGLFLSTNGTRSNLQMGASGRSPTSNWGCSDGPLLLALSLLSLVLGDQLALKAFENHPSDRERIEAILGPFANCQPSHSKENESSHQSATSIEENNSPLQRAPMPFDVAERAMDFILTSLWPSSDEVAAYSLPAKYLDLSKSLIPTLIDLVVQLPISNGAIGCYWAIQLLERFSFSLSTKAEAVMGPAEEREMRKFQDTCLDIASQVLSQIAEVDAEARIQFGEIQHPPNPHDRMPAGVPSPFGGRRDLNVMLAQHRSSQRKRKLQVNCAVKARKTAYKMVADLLATGDISESIQTLGDGDNSRSIVLEVPIVVLKCATGEEDTTMHQYVTQALDAVLAMYKRAIPKVQKSQLERLTASLLPSLLCAVCSDSSAARLAAARWVVEFVQYVDRDVACHVCSFLADDIDPIVSVAAKSALISMGPDVPMRTHEVPWQIQILDAKQIQDRRLIKQDLDLLAQSAAASFGIDVCAAHALLSDFDFDLPSAKSAVGVDQTAALKKCGILRRCSQKMNDESMGSVQATTCGICYDEIDTGGMFCLPCRHTFCAPCWRSFLECALKDRFKTATAPLRVSCPEQGCGERVLHRDVHSVAPELLQFWEDAVLQSYIVSGKNMTVCPGPDCTAVAWARSQKDEQPQVGRQAVQCTKCSTTFCFSCGSDPHEPANCSDFADWNRIFGSTQYWVKKNAKPCPGCHVPIEKNQGCSHIRCTQCSRDFCWLCLGTLRSHLEPHICNRYEPHQSAEDEEERRALFFTDRYKAHDDAEVFARNELKILEDRMNKLAAETLWFVTHDDLSNMLHATRTLVRARNFLKNSYVAAWAMRNDLGSREVFENHQANLELFTEKLSQLLLTKLQRLHAEQGAKAIHMHFRAMTFSTASLVRYMDRVVALGNQD